MGSMSLWCAGKGGTMWLIVTGSGLLAAIYLALLLLLHLRVPDVYMDEVFHDRQTRMYCLGRYDVWDDKITTPPGLYLVGDVVCRVIRVLTNDAWGPVTPDNQEPRILLTWFRATSAMSNMASLWLVYRIYRDVKKADPQRAALNALYVAMYPLIFFFGLLYYTDAGGLFCVLAMHYLSRRRQHLAAAAFGAASTLFRQTNIVWVAYALGTSIVSDLASRRAKQHDDKKPGSLPNPSAPMSISLLISFVWYLLLSWQRLLRQYWAYTVPMAAFLIFLYWNGGVVLGDKSHHQPVIHVAQLGYVSALAALTLNPLLPLSPQAYRGFASWLTTGSGVLTVLGKLCLLVVAGLLLDRYTLSHPFLVADNRHYTFYLWKRFLGRIPHLNAMLLPAYALCAWSVLAVQANTLSSGILALAVSLVLLPAHLLEPRYFTIPVVMAVIESPPRAPGLQLALGMLGFALINAITVYVFVFRPYTWGDGSVARFMW